MRYRHLALAAAIALGSAAATGAEITRQSFALPEGAYPHDVAAGPDGAVWYSGQRHGVLGRLDPATGKVEHIQLPRGSSPHGVIVGPDGAPWLTDGGLNAIVRVDPATRQIDRFPLPEARGYVNLNTAAFDTAGILWFTGQNGVYGRLDPKTRALAVWDAPKGRGPYGIAATPDGGIYFVSLAHSYLAKIDPATGAATVIEPPTKDQGARRVWSDSKGRLWISEWKSGQLSRYDPATKGWKSWKPPGDRPRLYAVYVDERDIVWSSDWGANAILRFDPATEQFQSFPLDARGADVRQLLGRRGEVWIAESGIDRILVLRFE
jgi:virginiamycin B lyase